MSQTIAILNNSGNVGKTTITRELFAANSPSAKIIEVENNCSGNKVFSETFDEYIHTTSEDFHEIYGNIIDAEDNEDVILDIGASSIVTMLNKFKEYENTINVIDIFVLPTTMEAKQMKDTLKTASILRKEFNVPAEKIILLPNRAIMHTIERDFAPIIKVAEKKGYRADPEMGIPEIEILKNLEIEKQTIAELIDESEDYTAKIKQTKGMPEQKKWIKKDLAKRKAQKAQAELREVYEYIIGNKEDVYEEMYEALESAEEQINEHEEIVEREEEIDTTNEVNETEERLRERLKQRSSDMTHSPIARKEDLI